MFICTCEETGIGNAYDECRSTIQYIYPYRYYRYGSGTIFMRVDQQVQAENSFYVSDDFALAMLDENNKYNIDLDQIESLYDSVLNYSIWVYLSVGIGSAYLILSLFIKCIACTFCGDKSNTRNNSGLKKLSMFFRVAVGLFEIVTGFIMLYDVGESANRLSDAMKDCGGCPYGCERTMQDNLLVVAGLEYSFTVILSLSFCCNAFEDDDDEGQEALDACELLLDLIFYFVGIGVYFGVWEAILSSIEKTAHYGEFDWNDIQNECGYSDSLLDALADLQSKIYEMYVFGDLMELLVIIGHLVFKI